MHFPKRPEEGVEILRNLSYKSCALPRECRELNLSLPQEQQAFLPAGPSPFLFFYVNTPCSCFSGPAEEISTTLSAMLMPESFGPGIENVTGVG